jgi:PTS system galactitol-specific IIA component
MCTHEDLVLIKLDASDRRQVIGEMAERVLSKGLITREFIDDVIEREQEYPTGLEFEIPIAIPHIGVGCNRSFLSLATLKTPVDFESMDGSEKILPVEIVVLFGITNQDDQVDLLKKFIFAFQEVENLKKIRAAGEPAEIIAMLDVLLDDCLDFTV